MNRCKATSMSSIEYSNKWSKHSKKRAQPSKYDGLSWEGEDGLITIDESSDRWLRVWECRRKNDREDDEVESHARPKQAGSSEDKESFPPNPPTTQQIQQGLASGFAGSIAPDKFVPPTTRSLRWEKWWQNRLFYCPLTLEELNESLPWGEDEDLNVPVSEVSGLLGYGDDLCLVSERGLVPHPILWEVLKHLQPILGTRFVSPKHRTLPNHQKFTDSERKALTKLGIFEKHDIGPTAMLTGGIT